MSREVEVVPEMMVARHEEQGHRCITVPEQGPLALTTWSILTPGSRWYYLQWSWQPSQSSGMPESWGCMYIFVCPNHCDFLILFYIGRVKAFMSGWWTNIGCVKVRATKYTTSANKNRIIVVAYGIYLALFNVSSSCVDVILSKYSIWLLLIANPIHTLRQV